MLSMTARSAPAKLSLARSAGNVRALEPAAADASADGTVIERSWADPELFAVIFDRHASEIYRYAARRLGAQAAADVLSDVFLVAFRNRVRYQPERADARPWLYGIATRVISDHLRTGRRDALLRAALPGPRPAELPTEEISDRLAAREQRPQLVRALHRLSESDRELVLLIAWADLSYAEVAQALDIPEGTVRSRLHRARAKLRDWLEAEPGATDRRGK
jgi:RNA polymerase sigma factor (sigma-70 family)